MALDFILHLKDYPPGLLHTRSALEKEFRRFIVRSEDPSSKEVWDGVSSALRQLASESRIRRLSGSTEDHNTNETVYSAMPADHDDDLVDLPTLDQRTEAIPPLSATRRIESRAEKKKPALCSPTEYRELVLKILKAAEGPAWLGDIHKITMERIPMARGVQVAAAEGDDVSDPASEPYPCTFDAKIWLDSEARERARLIWEGASGADLVDLLCGYLLPKWLELEKVTLSTFGSPQRAHEKIEELKDLMRRELPDPSTSDYASQGGNSGKRQEEIAAQLQASLNGLASVIFSQLQEKCSEKGENGSFH